MTRPPAPPVHGSPVEELPGFTHQSHQVNGTTLHLVTGGAGPLVVLLHGWPLTWRAWRPLLPLLSAAGFSVVAPDLRGTGDSARPDTGYAKREVAEDIHQLVGLLDHHTATVVGMDIGAMVAYSYAAAYPDEVSRLVLAESALPGFGLEALMNPATGGYWHFGFQMQTDLATWLTKGKEADYLTPTLDMFSAGGGLTQADRVDVLAHYTAPGGMRGGFQHYATLLQDGRDNRAGHDGRPARLAMPVLILNGEHGLPQHQLLDGVLQAATDVRADTVPAAGHTFAADNPSWTAGRLTRFIRDAG